MTTNIEKKPNMDDMMIKVGNFLPPETVFYEYFNNATFGNTYLVPAGEAGVGEKEDTLWKDMWEWFDPVHF